MISRIDIEDMTDAQDARREIVRLWGITHGRDFSWHQHMDIAVEQLRADLARPSQAGDERVAQAMEACRIIDAAVKKGHDNVSDLVMHLLSAAVPARAALAAMDTPKGGGDA